MMVYDSVQNVIFATEFSGNILQQEKNVWFFD